MYIVGDKEEAIMTTVTLRRKVIEEIQNLPEEKLREIYNVIHFFRVGVESVKSTHHDNIMTFAGCWDDIPDEEFHTFLLEITNRRSNAFSGRNHREAVIN